MHLRLRDKRDIEGQHRRLSDLTAFRIRKPPRSSGNIRPKHTPNPAHCCPKELRFRARGGTSQLASRVRLDRCGIVTEDAVYNHQYGYLKHPANRRKRRMPIAEMTLVRRPPSR